MDSSKSWIEADLLHIKADSQSQTFDNYDRQARVLVTKDNKFFITDGHYKIPATWCSLDHNSEGNKELQDKAGINIVTHIYSIVKPEHGTAHFVIRIKLWEPDEDSLLESTAEPIDINSLPSVKHCLQSCLLNLIDYFDSSTFSQVPNSVNDSQDLSVLIGLANQTNSQVSCHSQEELTLSSLHSQAGETGPSSQNSDKQAPACISKEFSSPSKSQLNDIVNHSPLQRVSETNVEKFQLQDKKLQVSPSQNNSLGHKCSDASNVSYQSNLQLDHTHMNVSPTELLQEMGIQSQATPVESESCVRDDAAKNMLNKKRSQYAVYKKGVPFTFPPLDLKTLVVPEDQKELLSQLQEWLPGACPPVLVSQSLLSSGTCSEDSILSRNLFSQLTLKDSSQTEHSNTKMNQQSMIVISSNEEAENFETHPTHHSTSKTQIENRKCKTPNHEQSENMKECGERSEGKLRLTNKKQDNIDRTDGILPSKLDSSEKDTIEESKKLANSDTQDSNLVGDKMKNSIRSKDCSESSNVYFGEKRKSTESQPSIVNVSSGSLFSDSDKEVGPANETTSLKSQNHKSQLKGSKLHHSDLMVLQSDQSCKEKPSSQSVHMFDSSLYLDQTRNDSCAMDSADCLILDDSNIDTVDRLILNELDKTKKKKGKKYEKGIKILKGKSKKEIRHNTESNKITRSGSRIVTNTENSDLMPSIPYSPGEELLLDSASKNYLSPLRKRNLSDKQTCSVENTRAEDTRGGKSSVKSSNETVDPRDVTSASNSGNSSETVFPSSSNSEPGFSDMSCGSTNPDEVPHDKEKECEREVPAMVYKLENQQSKNSKLGEKEDSQAESYDSPLLPTTSSHISRKQLCRKKESFIANENQCITVVSQPQVSLTNISPKIIENLGQDIPILVTESELNTTVVVTCGGRTNVSETLSKIVKSDTSSKIASKSKENHSSPIGNLLTALKNRPKSSSETRVVRIIGKSSNNDGDHSIHNCLEKFTPRKGLSAQSCAPTKVEVKKKTSPSDFECLLKADHTKNTWLRKSPCNKQHSISIRVIKSNDQTIIPIKRLAENQSSTFDATIKRRRLSSVSRDTAKCRNLKTAGNGQPNRCHARDLKLQRSNPLPIDLSMSQLVESQVSVPSRLPCGQEESTDMSATYEGLERNDTGFTSPQIPSGETTESQGFIPTNLALTTDGNPYPASQGFEPHLAKSDSKVSVLRKRDNYLPKPEIRSGFNKRHLESVQGLLNFVYQGDKSYFGTRSPINE